MAGLGNVVTTAIITEGLTGCGHGPLVACRSGLITTPFSLFCSQDVTPPTPVTGGGGGPYPRDAWNKFNPGDIKNFYQPVPQEYYIVPRDRENQFLRRYRPVTVTFKMGEFTVEKEFTMPEKRTRIVVKAFNLLETTRNKIAIGVSSVKKIVSDITITVTKFRKRDK